MAEAGRRVRLAVVGGYGVGLTFISDRIPRSGETVLARSFAMGPGGKGSNQAIGAARLGAEVALLTAIGEDGFADSALSLWETESVATSHVKRVSASTMAGAILVEPDGSNRILVAPGALSRLSVDDAIAFGESIRASDALLMSLEVPVKVAERACILARGHGVTTILNPAPATELSPAFLAAIDYLVPNRGEAAHLAGSSEADEPQDLMQRLREITTATIILTLGADGALIGAGDEPVVHIPAERSVVVDTTGAGDAFSAAFAVAVASGADAVSAARYGGRAGAHAVSIAEVVPSLPTRADIGDARGAPR